ncbi:MAG: hypothetical protein DLM63_05195 [Solirubrobacterales bacterium]|nr:MAG: hypothetical protein DLM63_05195 [Solirubrobacterales bacterium]
MIAPRSADACIDDTAVHEDHAHAVEMAREGVPLNVIQRQLGHCNLGVTSIYLQGIDTAEIIDTVHARPAPTILASAGLPPGTRISWASPTGRTAGSEELRTIVRYQAKHHDLGAPAGPRIVMEGSEAVAQTPPGAFSLWPDTNGSISPEVRSVQRGGRLPRDGLTGRRSGPAIVSSRQGNSFVRQPHRRAARR